MNFLFPYMARWKAVNWTRYHQIFTCLAKTGHNVHVIQTPPVNSIETNFQEIEVEIPDNLHLHEVDINPAIWNRNYPLNKLVKKGYYSLKSVKKVKEIINEFSIDVMVVYNIPQYPLMKIDSCFKIFDFADDYIEMLRHELGRLGNPVIFKIAQSILDKMIVKSDLTLVISKVLADSIITEDNEKVKVVPNGVDVDDMKCGNVLKEEFKKPVIGFIGSFEYFIDFDIILEAAARLKDYTFLLVGAGRRLGEVENKIKEQGIENIVLTGGVPHGEISGYINAMDICLNIFKKIPISHGASPIKLFEYMSMKKPVISTRLEEVENIDKGFLFYADTADEIIQQIEEILINKEKAADYADKGYVTTEQEYSWPKITQQLVQLIQQKKIK